MSDERFDREMVASVLRRKLLWGFLPFETALSSLQQAYSMLSPPGKNDSLDVDSLEQEWQQARNSIEDVDIDIADTTIRELPDDPQIEEYVNKLTDMKFFKNSYGRYDSVRFGLVPINKMIALQGAVTVTAHREIQKELDDLPALLEYVFPIEREQEYFSQTIQRDGNEHVGIQLTSRAPNVSVQDLRMYDGEQPMEKHIRFTVRAPPNLVNCVIHNDRIYLLNGYHRVYQLLMAGETEVPAIIRDADELPTDVGDMPHEVVLDERPPLLTDFASNATTEFRLPATNRLIRITAESTEVFR